jgi:hypothetical protein
MGPEGTRRRQKRSEARGTVKKWTAARADAARSLRDVRQEYPDMQGETYELEHLDCEVRLSLSFAFRSGHRSGFADHFEQTAHSRVVRTGKVLPFCFDPLQVELVRVSPTFAGRN